MKCQMTRPGLGSAAVGPQGACEAFLRAAILVDAVRLDVRNEQPLPIRAENNGVRGLLCRQPADGPLVEFAVSVHFVRREVAGHVRSGIESVEYGIEVDVGGVAVFFTQDRIYVLELSRLRIDGVTGERIDGPQRREQKLL